jgi:serine/threonine protein kinase
MQRVGTDCSLLSNGVKERAASPIQVDPDSKVPTFFGPKFQGEDNNKQYGRHGDINPANILWYNTGADNDASCGTLKIADFGQAELSSLHSKTKRKHVANTMTYRPPECDLEPSIIRQSYDIWCLACVYLEFIASLLGGSELCKKFAISRLSPDIFLLNQPSDTYYQVVRNPKTQAPEFMVKEAVTMVRVQWCTGWMATNMIDLVHRLFAHAQELHGLYS